MNIFEKIIKRIERVAPENKSNQVYNAASNVQKESDSILMLRKELEDPTLSPSEAAIAKVLLIMRLKKPK